MQPTSEIGTAIPKEAQHSVRVAICKSTSIFRSLTMVFLNSSEAPFRESLLYSGEIHADFLPQPGETVALEHWCSSGFANTDLDLLLKRHGVHKLVVIGLRANTCVESTIRHAIELGYEVTMVKDATASFSWDEMKASLEINLPSYASAILTAQEIVNKLPKG
jgi:nicotinamidase-related amidase